MDLDIKRVIKSMPKAHEDVEFAPLTTPWGEALDPEHVLEEHPNPLMQREHWQPLNGWWEYAIVPEPDAAHAWRTASAPQAMDGRIVVPFSPEAALSQVGHVLQPNELLWYRRELDVPAPAPGERTILHFEAVDWACSVYLGGELLGTHTGGYLAFQFDITDSLARGARTLELCVYDPSDAGYQLRGKQCLQRNGMWYTSQSGIWQSVWLEYVPEVHVASLVLKPDADAGVLVAELEVCGGAETVAVEVRDADGQMVNATMAEPSMPAGGDLGALSLKVPVPEPHLWSPDDPYLYDVTVTCGDDVVQSYCAFRTMSVEEDAAGEPRICLNHRPIFLRGVLDQGYWPDGLMTAPADEALVADIELVKHHGFNMVRKHTKVERNRWYWHCDRLGVLVMQDVPTGGDVSIQQIRVDIPTLFRTTWNHLPDDKPRWHRLYGAGDVRYREEWRRTRMGMLRQLGGHPCVIAWVLFNESWGQFDSAKNAQIAREDDPTRLVLATSGWYDQGAGDIRGIHNYFRSMRVYDRPKGDRRAFMLSEFGGLVCRVEGHSSVERTYGYDTYEDIPAYEAGLERLLASVDALEAEGMCGFVYTQISDVEEEVNGLITYDRRVSKLD